MSRTAVLAVDPQNGFCPGGELPVAAGHEIMEPLSRAIERVRAADPDALVAISRDMHPQESVHFERWPVHCVAGTWSAELHERLRVPADAIEIHKGQDPSEDAGYSAFEGASPQGERLADALRRARATRLVVGGLATDYCVRASVLDALREGLEVLVVREAVAGVDVNPGDSGRALEEMTAAGARVVSLAQLEQELNGEPPPEPQHDPQRRPEADS